MSEIDLDEVLEQVRQRAEERRRRNPEIEEEIQKQRRYFATEPAHRNPRSALKTYVEYLSTLAQAPGKLPRETRMATFKRAILRLVRPFTHQQVVFNSEVVRLLRELVREQEETVELVRTLSQYLNEGNREDARREFQKVLEKSSDPDLRTVAQESLASLSDAPLPEGFDYLQFEERFRGSEVQIKDQQRQYVTHLRHSEPVVDLGCGRGEFLEVLGEAQVEAIGVDSNPAMIERCRARGLKVHQSDLLEYLREQSRESLGGVVASHVIEHLSFEKVFSLIALAFDRLKTGGVLLIQSPNPASLFVFSHSFYLDPTHLRPYHPLSTEFFCRQLGFSSTELLFDSPVEERLELSNAAGGSDPVVQDAFTRLNQILFAPQDYTVICKK